MVKVITLITIEYDMSVINSIVLSILHILLLREKIFRSRLRGAMQHLTWEKQVHVYENNLVKYFDVRNQCNQRNQRNQSHVGKTPYHDLPLV